MNRLHIFIGWLAVWGCSSGPLPTTTDGGTDAGGDAVSDADVDDVSAEAAPDACSTFDFDTDPHNCGTCGRDCLGGTCTSGKCGVVTVATNEPGGINDIAADSTGAYWAAQGTSPNSYTDGVVRHVRFLNGVSDIKTLTTSMSPQGLAADGQSLYINFLGTFNGSGYAGDGSVIACAGLDCTSPTVLGPNHSGYSNVAVNSTTAFWLSLPGDGGNISELVSSPLTGGASPMKNGSTAQFVRATDTHVYGLGGGQLLQYTLPAGGWQPIDTETGEEWQLALDSGFAYFTVQDITDSTSSVIRCDIPDCAGGSIPISTNTASTSTTAVAVGATRVFWNVRATVYSCLKASCSNSTAVLVQGAPLGNQIFVMAEYQGTLYWGDNAGNLRLLVY